MIDWLIDQLAVANISVRNLYLVISTKHAVEYIFFKFYCPPAEPLTGAHGTFMFRGAPV